jgi:hypothetical protein
MPAFDKITRNRQSKHLCLSQSDYIRRILERFSMHSARSTTTPLPANLRLSRKDCPTPGPKGDLMKSVPYAPAVGSLMDAIVATQPDIAYAVGMVSRFMHNPGRSHWNAVKHIFRYLVGTQDYSIKFRPNEPSGPVGFTDSNYAGSLDTRKSTSGYFFRFGTGAISWRSKVQDCTATSTTEAEYVVTSDAAKKALWLGRLAHTFRQCNSKWIPTVLSDQPRSRRLSEESGTSQCFKAYRGSVSLRSGLRNSGNAQSREDLYD